MYIPGNGYWGDSRPDGTNCICNQCNKYVLIYKERAYKLCKICKLWCYQCHKKYLCDNEYNPDVIKSDKLLCGKCIMLKKKLNDECINFDESTFFDNYNELKKKYVAKILNIDNNSTSIIMNYL